MIREYPRWIHHPSGRSMIVNGPDHEAAQGEGWYDSPADFPASVPTVPGSDDLGKVGEGAEAKPKGKPGPKPKVKE